MKEILFKAKRIDNGEWVEGFVSYPHVTDSEKGVESYFFYAVDKCGFYSQCIIFADTLCQYTGLTDKNGNKIWEKDIVFIPAEDEYFIIEWSETEARWQMNSDTNNLIVDFDNYWSHEVEVVGNIIDNPELLANFINKEEEQGIEK